MDFGFAIANRGQLSLLLFDHCLHNHVASNVVAEQIQLVFELFAHTEESQVAQIVCRTINFIRFEICHLQVNNLGPVRYLQCLVSFHRPNFNL